MVEEPPPCPRCGIPMAVDIGQVFAVVFSVGLDKVEEMDLKAVLEILESE